MTEKYEKAYQKLLARIRDAHKEKKAVAAPVPLNWPRFGRLDMGRFEQFSGI